MFKKYRKESTEFGFGKQDSRITQRTMGKDGTFNVKRKGQLFFEKFSIFHYLINCKWFHFLFIMTLFFTFLNLFFALVFLLIGHQNFYGTDGKSILDNFLEMYFFSTQSFVTVGYGRINPNSNFWANFFAASDSFIGTLFFAILTGLLYGRFSKPQSKILFSDNAVIAPYKDGFGFMFRIANKLNHPLQNAEIKIILSMLDTDNLRKFFEVELERKGILFFTTTWTVVHPIDENSPFFEMTELDFKNADPEFIIQLKVYDSAYNQDTFSNFSYIADEVIWNAKYESILSTTIDGYSMVDFTKFNLVVLQ